MWIWLSLLLIAKGNDDEIREAFQDYVQQFRSGVYTTEEETLYRYSIFKENYHKIQSINASQSSYTLGITEFADMTQEEFSEKYLSKRRLHESISHSSLQDIPDSYDWVEQGGVTGVKNQGASGKSSAIVVVKTVETLHFKLTQELVSLSVQQVLDCAPEFSTVLDYFKYLIYAGGLMSDADYPSNSNGQCKFDRSKITAPVNDYLEVTTQNQNVLKTYNYVGTIAVAVDASSTVWQFYVGGIISNACGKEIDHEVLLVGYGAEDGTEFWKVQNTWGASWGESGYARLLRNGSTASWGECGIAIQPYLPILKQSDVYQ